VISGDTTPCETLRIAAHHADLLIHEATFAQDEVERAAETGHSTAGQAALLARDAEVTMLALTHFSTRYPAGVLHDEARTSFPATIIPRDFDAIAIPFPERGEPELVRWEDRPRPEPSAADPSAAEPSAAEPSAADPSAADPSAADPSAADPSAADPSPADPAADETEALVDPSA
jgi:ribonuclease Z